MHKLLALTLAAASAGCVGTTAGAGALHPGRVSCRPSMDCLPEPDVGPEHLSAGMRFGQMLAAGSFQVPPPAPPGEEEDVRRWWSEVLEPWVARKLEVLEAARRELDLAAEEDHRQRIIGGALVALMYEELADALRSIPPPPELRGEPEIRSIYERTLRSRASQFVEQARQAYSACAQNAVQPSSMRHWSRFCAAREDRLPEASAPRLAGSGETIVEVVAY